MDFYQGQVVIASHSNPRKFRNTDRHLSDEMIIRLGERMNMRVLAESVETEQQAEWLQSRGCTLVQGYLYAPPESLEQFLARLRKSQAGTA